MIGQMRGRRWTKLLAAGLTVGLLTASMGITAMATEVVPANPSTESQSGDAASEATLIVGSPLVDTSSSSGQTSTVTAGAGSSMGSTGTSSVVVAGGGSSSNSYGPSVYTSISTEGDKGYPVQNAILGGAELVMLQSQTEGQMMSFLLQTKSGSLIVVDGGRWDDGDYLVQKIRERGGRVSAWFLTHTHTDHVGALLKILTNEAAGVDTGIEIDHIYYNFASLDWYASHELSDYGTASEIISYLNALPETQRHTVAKGDVITVDEATVTVLNNRYEPSVVGERDGNDASIAYRMMVNGVSILFLGDMQTAGGQWLVQETGGNLKSDIVQMAHHGQNGVSEAVYQAINPTICLWPTPGWLWNNTSGNYLTPETKSWMNKLNVQRHYCTKDGDQTIR